MNVQPTNEQSLMQVAQQFLQRVDLKGAEVDAYAKSFNLITSVVEGQSVLVPETAWANAQAALLEQTAQKELKQKHLNAV